VNSYSRVWRRWALGWLVLVCAGCATVQPGLTPAQQSDPFESWNRKVFSFNEVLDDAILIPVATVYAEVVPPLVRRGIGNFYANLADAWSAVNNLLQGKPAYAGQVAFRFAVNSTFGLAGVLDLASEMGIERHYEDFGQTLGVWGAEPGAYLVWPLIGPSTVRDSIALPLNYAASPMYLFNVDLWGQFGIWSLQLVNLRAGLLSAGRLLDAIVLDKYTFVRDAFLQQRRSLILDGEEPATPDPSKEDEADRPAASVPPEPSALPASAPAQ
jgi:phospholipid-binding lipoprotein MlaA